MEKSPISILIVDAQNLFRQGLAGLINQQEDMEVIASAATGEEAVVLFDRYRPDMTLMDIQLPKMSGIEAIKVLRNERPDARVVVLTMYKGEEDIFRAFEAGAATYLLKDTFADELMRVIRDVHLGKRPISEDVQASLKERAQHQQVTPRELQVIELVSEGMRNKEIAVALGIREDTVQVHLRNIFMKLNVHDRTAVLAVAGRRGLIHRGS